MVVWPRELHPTPLVQGNEYVIDPSEELAILHYNYTNLNQYLEKAQRYARFEAEDFIKSRKSLTFGQTITKSLNEFISRFFAFEGYKDGIRGVVLSLLQMFYYFLVYFYYLEIKKYPESEDTNISGTVRSFFKEGLFETNFWMIKKNLSKLSDKIKIKAQNQMLKRS